MKTIVKDTAMGNLVPALISEAGYGDMPLKKDGWNFNWRQLYRGFEDALFYKLTLKASPEKVEGMMMITIQLGEMVFMNDLEVAPYNFGKNKKYDLVAGSLMAYACQLSLDLGKGAYRGFVVFESKTKLIEYYIQKYGAIHLGGQRLAIDPENGEKLIKKYLYTNESDKENGKQEKRNRN